ncbi:hypothetical protein [Novipirellula caenicola]|uniref:Uncharacterized protein n=1 Tax=Novipirellula caenicola TaxID=1536901 RepID=A0ABP9VYY7_9BACT
MNSNPNTPYFRLKPTSDYYYESPMHSAMVHAIRFMQSGLLSWGKPGLSVEQFVNLLSKRASFALAGRVEMDTQVLLP